MRNDLIFAITIHLFTMLAVTVNCNNTMWYVQHGNKSYLKRNKSYETKKRLVFLCEWKDLWMDFHLSFKNISWSNGFCAFLNINWLKIVICGKKKSSHCKMSQLEMVPLNIHNLKVQFHLWKQKLIIFENVTCDGNV